MTEPVPTPPVAQFGGDGVAKRPSAPFKIPPKQPGKFANPKAGAVPPHRSRGVAGSMTRANLLEGLQNAPWNGQMPPSLPGPGIVPPPNSNNKKAPVAIPRLKTPAGLPKINNIPKLPEPRPNSLPSRPQAPQRFASTAPRPQSSSVNKEQDLSPGQSEDPVSPRGRLNTSIVSPVISPVTSPRKGPPIPARPRPSPDGMSGGPSSKSPPPPIPPKVLVSPNVATPPVHKGPPPIGLLGSSPSVQSSDGEFDLSKRRPIVLEIVNTEETFRNDLQLVVEKYVVPLRGMPKSVAPADQAKLFSNIEIIAGLSSQLLEALQARLSDAFSPEQAVIGDIFIQQAPHLSAPFSMYCLAHSEALQLLSKLKKKSSFREAVEQIELDESLRGLHLLDFVVKPVQRICKYPLLLRELQKATPEGHPDFDNMTRSLNAVEHLVENVNQTARESENLSNIVRVEEELDDAPPMMKLLVPGRRFLLSGKWTKISGRNFQERQLFLFNDMIIYARPSVVKKDSYSYKGVIPLHQAKFEDIPDSGEVKNAIKITRMETNKSYIIYSDTEMGDHQKKHWLFEILAAQKEIVEAFLGVEKRRQSGVAFVMAESSPDLRIDSVIMLQVEGRIQGWQNDSITRRFIAEVDVKFHGLDNEVESKGHIFLFNDIALLTKRVKEVTTKSPYVYKETIDLSAMVVEDLDLVDRSLRNSVTKQYFAFTVVAMSSQQKYTLYFKHDKVKAEWLRMFAAKCAEFLKMDPTAIASESRPVSTYASTQPDAYAKSGSNAYLFNQQIEQLSESKNKDGTAGLKTKKSFFGRKLGYHQDKGKDKGKDVDRSTQVALSTSDGNAVTESADASSTSPSKPLQLTPEGFEIPPWDPDDTTDVCSHCSVKFSFKERKHHCRNCGHIFCATCTSKKCFLPRYGFTKKKKRVCDRCFLKH